jgi:hypothetical protein
MVDQNFREMYIWHRTLRRQAPVAAPRGVKSLPPRGTAVGAWFQRHGGAAWCQDPAAERHGGRSVPPSGTAAGSFLFFLVFLF